MKKAAEPGGTVGKALSVLDIVAGHDRPLKFNEILEESKYPKPTVFRLAQTLVNQNLLNFNKDSGTYTLGVRLITLAHAAWKTASLAPIARQHVLDLAQKVKEAVHLAQLDNGQVIFVDKILSTNQYETLARIGEVAPAYCTGVGKAMLAFIGSKRLEIALKQQSYHAYTSNTHTSPEALYIELKEIQKSGLAFDREEHEKGIISIASPICADNGSLIGALSIATSTNRHDINSLKEFTSLIEKTAQEISADAAAWHF